MTGRFCYAYNGAMNAILQSDAPLESPNDRHFHLDVAVIAIPVKGVKQESGMSVMLKGLSSYSLLPVIDKKKRLVGVIREQDVLLATGPQDSDNLMSLRKGATIKNAFDKFSRTEQSLIPIVDEHGRYTGQCASKTLLLRLIHGLLRPQRVGGLATPLGVYMTSGQYISGAGIKGLVVTGLMFGLMTHILSWVTLAASSMLIAVFPNIVNMHFVEWEIIQQGLMLVSFLSLVRLTPISALHAAEHMTINAMENDLELDDETVRTQPREHARCGTNLMVLFTGIMLLIVIYPYMLERLNWVGSTLYLLAAALLLSKVWYSSGLWLQRNFTTKDPSKAQLASGLRAGQELLDKFSADPHPNPTFLRKLWGSGMPIMLVSYLLSLAIFSVLIFWVGSGFDFAALQHWDFKALLQ